MRKTWLWALSGMFILAGVSYAVFLLLAPPPLPEGFLYGNGQIEATEVTVSAEVTGRVLESNLVEGSKVKAGDVLVRLDESDLETRLKQAKAGADAAERNRAQAMQQLATLRHHLQSTEAELMRYRKLRESGTVSAQGLERVQDQYQEALGRARVLDEQRKQADASLEAASQESRFLAQQVDKAVIRAPSAGTLLSKGIEPGELAAPGRVIAVLGDLARLELKIYIPEAEIGKVKLGEPARVRVDAFPQRQFEARVARVDSRAQFTPKDVHMPDERARLVFGVTLAVDNPEGYLKPGMPADAWVRWQPEAQWPAQLAVPR